MRTLERVAVAAVVVLGGLAAFAHYDHWAAVAAFAVATLALAGIGVGRVARDRARRRAARPAATGLLQATLGNLPELFVVIFALRAGEQEVAQSAIVGSLFATSLLVLGLVVIVGSLTRARRRHALRRAGAARRLDAAAGLRLHHRAGRPLAVFGTPRREPPRQDDLGDRGRAAAGRSTWPG
jgi:calcium/proton exchanger cax